MPNPKGYSTAYYRANKERLAPLAKERQRKNKASVSRNKRNYDIRSYGISLEEFQLLRAAQLDKCAICKQPETAKANNGEVRALSIDHDHVTGKVRGLLCHKCNMAIGHFEDDVQRLQNTIQYLEDK